MKILYSIAFLPLLSHSSLAETVDIKLTPLMQTEELGDFKPVRNIVLQASSKSSIELISAEKAFILGGKGSWNLDGGSLKKDIKTGDLIFNLVWNSETNPVPNKLSESIGVIYGSKKLKKETHNITKAKGEIILEGFVLNYEISKDTSRECIEICFDSEESIIIQGLQLLSDDNKAIKQSLAYYFIGLSCPTTIRVGQDEAKKLKKVRLVYYPGPYKTVKVPVEATLPLK